MSSRLFASAALCAPMAAKYLSQHGQLSQTQEAECADPEENTRRAICVMNPDGGSTASGVVKFEQPHWYAKCKIDGEFKGLSAGKHGFHIH